MAGSHESNCDLLIIGAGPAGLMAATWAAHTKLKARIIDKRGTKVFNGQADGLQCRTLEIFDSFGFADRVWKESNHMLEFCFWNPDEKGVIRRTDRLPDTIPGISRFHEVVLHQGRIERFFLDSIRKHSDIKVERGVLPEDLQIDESEVGDFNSYPIKVKLRHLDENEATPAQNHSNIPDGLFRSSLAEDDTDRLISSSQDRSSFVETVNAKFVIGADGAHSWTRRKLGFEMEGEQTDFIVDSPHFLDREEEVWWVHYCRRLTFQADIRCRCAIHSADSGSMMVIPRENKLVRFYIQLVEIGTSEGKADRSKINPEMILKAAQKIIAPYKISYHYIDWWTGYQIGQRVANQFTAFDRLFLVGDAVHTHSPKAGQGMNVSMQDSYNLVWKIANVVNGFAKPAILKTYQSERRRIAQDLIDFDHKFSRLFSGRPAKDAADSVGISLDEFKSVFQKGAMFAAGLSVDYGPSLLVCKSGDPELGGDGTLQASGVAEIIGKQELARNAKMGMRFPSAQVVNQSSSRPDPFSRFLRSDGRFRIVLFAGNLTDPTQRKRVETFCEQLSSPNSFLFRFTPRNARVDSVIELLTIHSGPRKGSNLLDLPDILHPFDEATGWDYDKVFVDDESYHQGHGHAYDVYGVDKQRGCILILRPDQHVSWIGELEDNVAVDGFFSRLLIQQQ